MSIKRITAIVPIEILTTLEKHLRRCGIPGITVEKVSGYGEHPNYFRKDLMQENSRLILYALQSNVDDIIEAIAACARECGIDGGIVAVEDIDRLVSLADGSDVPPASLQD